MNHSHEKYNATALCNKLEKQIPPPFITVSYSVNSKNKNSLKYTSPAFLIQELCTAKNKQEKSMTVRIFGRELDLLNGFIERKGTQLRLEKALQFSNQILKLGFRWKANEFYLQLDKFVRGDSMNTSKSSKQNLAVSFRLPSLQWAQWVAYLCLREAALLAKIIMECEKATKFWLGLISSSHHWGDSLVVTGILSRIWHLSSVMFNLISGVFYPVIYKLVQTLRPNDAPLWPTNEFIAPNDINLWLEDEMNLKWSAASNSKTLRLGENSKVDSVINVNNCTDKSNLHFPEEKTIDTKNVEYNRKNLNCDDEDVGIVVEPKKTKKPKSSNKTRSKKWTIVFKKHQIFLRTAVGRRKLFIKLKKTLKSEGDEKIKLKLRNIQRSILASSDDDFDKAIKLIARFHNYVCRKAKAT